ncbi:YdcF family protein [Candidatus Saccharibacteria bacterium]|nr:YdcF family protein [Candidatus Saccharibacteria bacterium]
MSPNQHTKRKSHLGLPAGNEIMHISNAEEKREPVQKSKHFVDFRTIKNVYNHFDLDTAIFDKPGLEAKNILDSGGELNSKLVGLILNAQLSTAEIGLLQSCYSYLSEQDEPKAADYIYVFGARTPLRVEKAVELYREKLAPKVIFSGRGPFYGKSEDTTEAEQYAAIALKSGVPESDIIIEDGSITIPDNVRRTLNMMDAKDMTYDSFIVVNSPYTQRRGWCVWKKHTAANVQIHRINSRTKPEFSSEGWYKNQNGLLLVLGEFIKLRNTIAFNDA